MEARKWGRRWVVVVLAVAVTATEGSTAGEEDGGGDGGSDGGQRWKEGEDRGYAGNARVAAAAVVRGWLREWDESRGEASYFARSVHCPNLPSCFFLRFFP